MFGLHDRLRLDKECQDKGMQVDPYLRVFKNRNCRRCFSKRIGLSSSEALLLPQPLTKVGGVFSSEIKELSEIKADASKRPGRQK